MKKIENRQEQQDRKNKKTRNQIILGILLISVMVISTFGYALRQEREEKVNYNGFSFVKVNNGWQVQNQPFSLVTRYLPAETESINSKGIFSAEITNFANKQLYFVAFSSSEKAAISEIARNIPLLRAQPVCLEEDSNRTECFELPLKNCFDDSVMVISQIKQEQNQSAPEERVYKERKCIFITADSENILKAADRFLFALYSIQQ